MNNYFYVDGSCLLGDIQRLWASNEACRNRKLCLQKLYKHFTGSRYRQFLGSGYRRFSVYFVNNENRLESRVIIPDFSLPNQIEDFHVTYCGKKLSGTKKVDDWLAENRPPQYVMDRFNKSEKAVDTQICCDALQLAANKRIDRLFLYTNDYDFMPLLDVLKSLGVNVSLLSLTNDSVNGDLVKNADSYMVPSEDVLLSLFI